MAVGRWVVLAAAMVAAEAKLLLSAGVHASPYAPIPPIIRPCMKTCRGRQSSPCESKECQASMQPGWQCFNTTGPAGCLMNHTSKLNCTSARLPTGEWARACCIFGYKQCDGGCYRPQGGELCSCGKTWLTAEACCMSKAATQAQQAAAQCCIRGIGMNCESPGQLDPCCLDSSNARSDDHDPFVPCQRNNCSRFVKCYYGIGWECAAKDGHNESIGKKRCCLSKGGPYPHDTCRKTPTCDDAGYLPCLETGVDCSSQHGEACCLDQLGDQDACRRGSCGEYRREQEEERKEQEEKDRKFQNQVYWMLAATVVLLAGLAARPCYTCARRAVEFVMGWRQDARRVRQDVQRVRQDSELLLGAAQDTSQSVAAIRAGTGVLLEVAHGTSQSVEAIRTDTGALLEVAHGTSQAVEAIRTDTDILLEVAQGTSQSVAAILTDTDDLLEVVHGTSHAVASIHAGTGVLLGVAHGTSQSVEAIRVDTDVLVEAAHGTALSVAGILADTDDLLEVAHGTSKSTAAIRADTGVLLEVAHGTSQSVAAIRADTEAVLDATVQAAHGTSQSINSLQAEATAMRASIEQGQHLVQDNASTTRLRPLVQFQRRVAYTIGCTEYRGGGGKGRLANGNSSAEAVGQSLGHMGFERVHRSDATRADIDAGLKEAVQRCIQGGGGPGLLVIYFSGHGIEGDRDGLCWLGIDYDPEDPTTHFSVREMQSKIMDAGTRPWLAKTQFGCDRALGELYVVVLADNCRGPGPVQPRAYDGPKRTPFLGSLFRKRVQPTFLTVFATGAGQKARDGDGLLTSPFARAFCELLPKYPTQTIRAFFDEVSLKVVELTGGAQRCVQLLDHDMPWNVCLGLVHGVTPASAGSAAATAGTLPSSSAVASTADPSSFSSAPAPTPR